MYQEEVEPDVFEPLYNTTSPTVAGAGTDGYLPGVDSTGAAIGTDAKKGAIVLAPASLLFLLLSPLCISIGRIINPPGLKRWIWRIGTC